MLLAYSKNKGFTLIEMLATIAIMALILSLIVANINGTEQGRNAFLTENILVSDLHKVQTYAVNSQDYSAGVTPSSAWGINIGLGTPDNYVIQSSDNSINPVTQNVSTTYLSTHIAFTTLQVQRPNGGGLICATSLTIQFSVPYGRVLASYSGAPCGGGGIVNIIQEPNDVISLTVASTVTQSITKTVVINGISGNIITP